MTRQQIYHMKHEEESSTPPYLSKNTYLVFLDLEAKLDYLEIR